MTDGLLGRLEELERRVARLEGRPDPGRTCPGTDESACCGGKVKTFDRRDNWAWSPCPTCGGKGRVYPELA